MSFELLPLETIQEIAQQYGYWAVFGGIALESAGIPLPGETITLVGGFLAGSGELNYWLVLSSAIAGAVIGDNCGYWVGKVGGWSFLLRIGRLFRFTEEQLGQVKAQFSENAAKAVFFGRFVALLRIFAGPMAGIAQMPYPQFLLCNFAGGTLWASVMVSLSFFFGRLVPLEELISWMAQLAIVALGLFIVSIVIPKWWKSRQIKISSIKEQL
ncbi:MAG: DedA family protein [Symploca sp. SIO3C6]|uniref:DedA family protein n=1 Tax=Symploca sp. SIO1C4 TaxID=2607765 RepID=A0A6B3NMH5_9CYAN|nr:DedA family protein [Symploca sp. SIO3C6]NER31582.1 DedA family protein [Symploca sp. SIO1C4]NET08142.1 DedA family protein [Symploca sp. SIO2B6]NET52302.1 DedA family protein [Merismopedia sp. SIO2A8]